MRKEVVKNIARSKGWNPPECVLRADIATDIRAIVNLERLLKTKIGTNKASKMRRRVKTLRVKVDSKIALVKGRESICASCGLINIPSRSDV